MVHRVTWRKASACNVEEGFGLQRGGRLRPATWRKASACNVEEGFGLQRGGRLRPATCRNVRACSRGCVLEGERRDSSGHACMYSWVARVICDVHNSAYSAAHEHIHTHTHTYTWTWAHTMSKHITFTGCRRPLARARFSHMGAGILRASDDGGSHGHAACHMSRHCELCLMCSS